MTDAIAELRDATHRYGAKGAVLQYVVRERPEMPIPQFIPVGCDEDWRRYREELGLLGRHLVRSSSPYEDASGRSFAGLFPTMEHFQDWHVDEVLQGALAPEVCEYAANRGLAIDGRMGLVFQQLSSSTITWSMAQHPHDDALWFFMGRTRGREGDGSYDYMYDQKTDHYYDVCDSDRKPLWNSDTNLLWEARKAFESIAALPAFQTGYSYQMEFGTSPFAVYQFRSFRHKEPMSWSVRDHPAFEDSALYSFVFGKTSKEGEVFDVVRMPVYSDMQDALKITKDWSDDRFAREFSTLSKLAVTERAYADAFRQLSPDSRCALGYNPEFAEAYGRAVRALARPLGNRACISQESIQFYHGPDIDTLAPAAGAWVTNGRRFLSHRWFRPAQEMPLAVLDACLRAVTGDRLRIISDGLEALIFPE